MTLSQGRPLVALLLVASATWSVGCGLLWSFDGYAGNPLSDGGANSAHDSSRSPDAHRDASTLRDARTDSTREGAADASSGHDALRDALDSGDGGGDAGATVQDACPDSGCSPCDGMCPAVTLDPGPIFGVSAIAIDETSVYWTTLYGNSIGSVKKDGGGPTSLTQSASYLTSIVVVGGVAYFGSTLGYIASCPTTGCPAGGYEPLLKDDGGDIEGVAAIGRSLFGIDEHLHGGAPAVLRAIIDGGSFDAAPTSSSARLTGIAATEAGVFWSTVGAVYSCATAECSAELVASVPQSPAALAVNAAADVFWLTSQGNLMTCSHTQIVAGSCSSPTPLTPTPIAGAAGLAVDDTDAYVSTSGTTADGGASNGDGTIVRCSQSGCPDGPTLLAAHESSPGPIAVDGTFVYWADTHKGSSSLTCPIRSLRKP